MAGCLAFFDQPEPAESADESTATPSPTETPAPDVRIDNPYEGLEWSAVEHHKCEFHNHPEKWEEPHRMVDLYHGTGEDDAGNTLAPGDEYTIYSISDMGIRPMLWPWTEMSEIEGEDRDPEELGVVAFPGSEVRSGIEHISMAFSTATDAHHDADTQLEALHEILDADTDHPNELAVIAHPERYYHDPDESWTRYREHFAEFSLEDGLAGLEVLNRDSTNRGFGRDEGMTDLTVWDHLLTEFMPDRPILGYSVDDAGEFVIGEEVDIRWTEILLEADQFDPSDQPGSRDAAMEAMKRGQVLGVEREPWNHDEEAPPTTPTVHGIDVDRETITIEASNYDVIDWISAGEVVAHGPAVTLTPDETPYVRAEIWKTTGKQSVAITQPFGVSAPE